MPTTPLPEHPSLEHLKGQAKLVQQLVRAGDEGALAMVDEFHPRLDATDLDGRDRSAFKRSDAQLIVARMYRFPSWSKLREHLKVVDEFSFTPSTDDQRRAGEDGLFVSLACLNYDGGESRPIERIERAHRMLEAEPGLASGSLEALCTVGDHQALVAMLDASPSLVNRPCGPNGWAPLLYATYSRIETDNPAWSAIKTVALLLARDADPNAGFLWRGLVPPFTALTGAFGHGERAQPRHPDRLEIGRLLLEAGADPNDGQTLYNNGLGGPNHDDPAHLELLIEFGLGTEQNGPWYRRLGDQLREPEELLYDELEVVAVRGRPKSLEVLMNLGLDLERPVGRSQQTPVRLAAGRGHLDVLRLLAEVGIDTELLPEERFLNAIRSSDDQSLATLIAGEPSLLPRLRSEHPGVIKNVTVEGGAVLSRLVGLGFDIDARTGGSGTTALHDAALADDVPLARLLIEHGADPEVTDANVGATPWSMADHFKRQGTAAYLHPLTTHDGPIDVTIRASGDSSTVSNVVELDAALDEIDDAAGDPVLVQLSSGGSTLSIGLGDRDWSVALYLDPDGQPWHAVEETDDPPVRVLAFVGDGGRFEFNPGAAVSPATARRVARAFAQAPTEQPSGVEWRKEGNSG